MAHSSCGAKAPPLAARPRMGNRAYDFFLLKIKYAGLFIGNVGVFWEYVWLFCGNRVLFCGITSTGWYRVVEVATMSKLLKIVSFFCKRVL